MREPVGRELRGKVGTKEAGELEWTEKVGMRVVAGWERMERVGTTGVEELTGKVGRREVGELGLTGMVGTKVQVGMTGMVGTKEKVGTMGVAVEQRHPLTAASEPVTELGH